MIEILAITSLITALVTVIGISFDLEFGGVHTMGLRGRTLSSHTKPYKEQILNIAQSSIIGVNNTEYNSIDPIDEELNQRFVDAGIIEQSPPRGRTTPNPHKQRDSKNSKSLDLINFISKQFDD